MPLSIIYFLRGIVRRHQQAGLIFVLAIGGIGGASADSGNKLVEKGRYLVKTSGCYDCHTPGYPEAGRHITEQLGVVV